MAEQRDLGQGTGTVDQGAQLGEHQRQHEGHGASGDPGQQAGRTGVAGGEVGREEPAGSDRAGDHGQGEGGEPQIPLQFHSACASLMQHPYSAAFWPQPTSHQLCGVIGAR